jgi:hypothetical protein
MIALSLTSPAIQLAAWARALIAADGAPEVAADAGEAGDGALVRSPVSHQASPAAAARTRARAASRQPRRACRDPEPLTRSGGAGKSSDPTLTTPQGGG